MIHFMIDFENTRNRGLQGAEYLQPDDSVTIFYSQVCMKIEWKWFCQLKESGCNFRICKLQKAGKNALDFYIASHIGEMYGQGYNGMTAIVSNDAGFRAVREYWKNCFLYCLFDVIRISFLTFLNVTSLYSDCNISRTPFIIITHPAFAIPLTTIFPSAER